MKIARAFDNWYRYLQRFWPHLAKTKPVIRATFTSSFIQYWYCQNWDLKRWLQEYRMLQKIGIDEIIIQSIADTKTKYTVYPTKMEGYISNSIDMVGTAFEAAQIVGMNVRIGLGFNNDWWVNNAYVPEWLNSEARVNKNIVSEIVSMYGSYESLVGWYIPYEFHQSTALGHVQQANFNRFLREIAGTIKLNSDKTIMIAPFYNSRLSRNAPFASWSWSTTVYHSLSDTGIDIVALQDSIGAGFNTLDRLDKIYCKTKKVTDAMGITLYAITETFDVTLAESKPASCNRIKQQMAIEAPYVQCFVAFSIDHYQNGNEPSLSTGYEDYERYFLDQDERKSSGRNTKG
ncbi:MAG: DUF4434 domain-containing protein [Desulfosporosinus sp.]|nr:DUF4434 domain-containing protein [Desulfosporosinus sp.]